ncbi:MAG TPA: hypothetical protein DDY98_08365 [Ruminococcaceae bacterium]|nr:hypothetical protein [Oscillospiraceae bacterium]
MEAIQTAQRAQTSRDYRLKITEQGKSCKPCICWGENGFAVRLLTQEDLVCFVDFLNENRIEPTHLEDCYRDFLYEHFKREHR